jgi:hypothetical protein
MATAISGAVIQIVDGVFLTSRIDTTFSLDSGGD